MRYEGYKNKFRAIRKILKHRYPDALFTDEACYYRLSGTYIEIGIVLKINDTLPKELNRMSNAVIINVSSPAYQILETLDELYRYMKLQQYEINLKLNAGWTFDNSYNIVPPKIEGRG